jgi:hypothetical protein
MLLQRDDFSLQRFAMREPDMHDSDSFYLISMKRVYAKNKKSCETGMSWWNDFPSTR